MDTVTTPYTVIGTCSPLGKWTVCIARLWPGHFADLFKVVRVEKNLSTKKMQALAKGLNGLCQSELAALSDKLAHEPERVYAEMRPHAGQ